MGNEELAPSHRKSSQSSKVKKRTPWQDVAECPSQVDPVLVLKCYSFSDLNGCKCPYFGGIGKIFINLLDFHLIFI